MVINPQDGSGAVTPAREEGRAMGLRLSGGIVNSRIVSGVSGTSTTVTGLTLGESYTVSVRAYDAAGNASPWSSPVTFTTVGTPVPATVAGTTTVPTPTVVVPGPIPSTVAGSVAIPSPAAGAVRATTSAGTTVTVTGLLPNTPYKATVRAYDAAGNKSAWTAPLSFTTTAASTSSPATVLGSVTIPATAVGGAPPTLTAGVARPVVTGGSVLLDVTAVPPGAATISSYTWAIQGGGAGSLTNSTTATPTYTPPGSGSGVVTIRATVTTSNSGTAFVDMTVSYHTTIVAAENALTGTSRATWDLADPNLGGVSTLQGFADGFTVNRNATVNFKIAQSDTAGWTAQVYRLGYYGSNGARLYETLTPSGAQLTASQGQPAPADADPDTTLLSADCAAWSTTLTWTPPSWAPSGFYILRMNRTGGGASQVMFILRDDSRTADLMVMPSDSTWNAYNAWGGMGSGQYAGNSLYLGTAVNQYDADCAHYVSYNRPVVNRGAADTSRSYGAVKWSTFFTGEYPMVRFLERNGYDVKYYGCIDAAGDPNGTHLLGNGSTRAPVKTAMMIGHNEYWSDNMRAGWEYAKNRGVNIFTCASNEVFWRLVGSSADSDGRPRVMECQKSTINGRGSTRPSWTGTWRDTDGAGKGGGFPENTFTGTIFMVNGADLRNLVVPFTGGYSAQPLWRNSSVGALASGSYTSGGQIVGFEWDTYGPAGTNTTGATWAAAPHPRARYCSDATYSVVGQVLTDAGDVYGNGTVTHRLVVHPGGAGAVCFATGTINWSFGLDAANAYQAGVDNTDAPLQQATINMLTDMGATPATVMSGMTLSAPVDWYPDIPTSTVLGVVSFPAPSFTFSASPAPATVAGAATVPAPATSGSALAAPATVAGAVAIPAPTVRLSVLPAPATVASAATVPAPGVASTAAPATVAGTVSIPAPTVRLSALPAPVTVAAATTVPAPGIASTVTPATVAGSVAVPAPAVRLSALPAPGVVAGVATVPAPSVALPASASPATVTGSAAVPTPSIALPGVISAATVSGAASVPAPTLATATNATATPTTVSGSVSVSGAAGAGAVALPPTVAGAVTLGASTVATGARPVPVTVSATVTAPTPTVPVGGASAPATVSGAATVPAPSVIALSIPSPATLAGQAAIAAATVLASTRPAGLTVLGGVAIPGPAVVTVTAAIPATVTGSASVPVVVLRASGVVITSTVPGVVKIGSVKQTLGAVIAGTGSAAVSGVTLTPGVTGDSISAGVQ